MAGLSIRVGDLAFTARWEAAAPLTVAAIRRMLPVRNSLIHCRWSGESTWIPYGEFRPGIDYENHTSHPAPGQLAANHFATIEADEGWADRLREVGRRCLWDGAQAIVIEEI